MSPSQDNYRPRCLSGLDPSNITSFYDGSKAGSKAYTDPHPATPDKIKLHSDCDSYTRWKSAASTFRSLQEAHRKLLHAGRMKEETADQAKRLYEAEEAVKTANWDLVCHVYDYADRHEGEPVQEDEEFSCRVWDAESGVSGRDRLPIVNAPCTDVSESESSQKSEVALRLKCSDFDLGSKESDIAGGSALSVDTAAMSTATGSRSAFLEVPQT